VVFEGVDGSGKTTMAGALAKYYKDFAPDTPLYVDNFPGSIPGTLGEWVYRLHHNRLTDNLSPENIAPPALQLLHVAAHIDTILERVAPTFEQHGNVILDRYWWSTYAYSRYHMPSDEAWNLVYVERTYWAKLLQPIVIYLTRSISLKSDEMTPLRHTEIDGYYHELLGIEREAGICVYEINNDGSLENLWASVLTTLHLPYQKM